MGLRKTLEIVILISFAALVPAAAQDQIRIGVIAALSGFGENEGKQFIAGTSAAQNDLRQIANRPVEVISRDHQNKPDVAAQMSRQLIESERVDFLIVRGGASVMLATAGVSEQQHTPTVFIGLSKMPFSDRRQQYSFHIGDSVEHLAEFAIDYAKGNQEGRTSFLFESSFYAEPGLMD